MQLNSLTHFRAIAILFIIAGHSFRVTGMEIDTWYDAAFENILRGGTSLFVFISGFLFHHIFYAKYAYKNFIIKKLQNVLVPYFILGFIPIYFTIGSESLIDYFPSNGNNFLSLYIVPFIKYYISGKFLVAYWYVPFIFATFLLSPIHMKYIELKTKYQLLIIFSMSLISILMHRPLGNISVIQSLIYFSPIYLIGMTASINKLSIYEFLKGKELYLIFLVVFLAFIQAYIGDVGNYHKSPFQFGGLDLIYPQKIALSFFFLVLLHRFEQFNNSIVNNIAATSFTAFFIHPFILLYIHLTDVTLFKHNSWLVFLIFVGALTISCVAIAKIVKKTLPKYSRYIIGY